ncbi:MAG: hypothetical protein FJW23_06560 [Acidimicrobiia bacterium]|nr:hypothetical protein [Acidimicrobiia bacterium]
MSLEPILPSRSGPAGPALTVFALAGACALALSWCILRSPQTLHDSLDQLLASRQSPSVWATFQNGLYQEGYFRPLRVAQAKAAFDLAPEDPVPVYKSIHVALTCTAFLLFAALVRPRSWPEAVAGAVAITILMGHHAFFILVAEAYPINHFLEMVVLALGAALAARGARRLWKEAAMVLALAVALLTLESGVIVWVVAAGAWAVGWRGVSGRAIAVATAVLAAYMVFRFGVADVGSPGLGERASGFGLERLEADEIVARFGGNPWPFFAYNVASALSGLLLSEPRHGTWMVVRRWLAGDVAGWQWINLAASLLVTGVVVAAARTAWARARLRQATDRDRLILLGVAVVLANAALSFGYLKDEVMSLASTFYAAAAAAALSPVAERLARRPAGGAYGAAALLLVVSLLWTSRAASTVYSLRSFAYRTQVDWGTYEMPDTSSPDERAFFDQLRRDAIGRRVPNPRDTDERAVQGVLEIK